MDFIEENWELIKQTIKKEYELSNISYNTWISKLSFYSSENDVITISIPSEQSHALSYINNKYKSYFQGTISEMMDHDYEISFVLEKDISKKLEEKGYQVTVCKVKAEISDKEEETPISKIKINVQKSQENVNEAKKENEENLENEMVTQIQKIKTIDTSIQKDNTRQGEKTEDAKSNKINKSDIQNIKKFLIEEYGVSEKCLEIN